MKLISFNVNGIRAAIKKGLLDWLTNINADIVCFQETKANQNQIEIDDFRKIGYHVYWNPADKKGYSGVTVLTKIAPHNITLGMGSQKFDNEGRIIKLDFETFSLINTYFPSGSSGSERQAYKLEYLKAFFEYIVNVKKTTSNIALCGDFNICHQPIDIHNPNSNKNSPGFTPMEREWLSKLLDHGFIDTFRYFNKEPHNYSWWSLRSKSRDKNLGWRIDYFLTSYSMKNILKSASLMHDVYYSDHCPISLELSQQN
jgi:exodeoxyribonuclease-3